MSQRPEEFLCREINHANQIMPAEHSARADESSVARGKPGLGARGLIGEAEYLAGRSQGINSPKQGIVAAVYLGQTTEISLKGDVKSRKQNDCRYGPDGTVQKTPTTAPTEQKKKRGLRGKIVEGKKEELGDYMERAASLVKRYVPLDPSRMQSAVQGGKGTLQLAPEGKVVLSFRDYDRPGDEFALTFDGPGRRIDGVKVRSYLGEPEDAVGLNLTFSNLPDGTNYLSESLLDAPAKKVQIKTTNFGHQK